MDRIIVADRSIGIAEAIREDLLKLVIPAEDAGERATAAKELQCMARAEQIEVLTLRCRIKRQQQVILEDTVLPDRLGAAAPADEFELGDPQIGL